ncbi:MAG: permease [Planctomycetes bacterium]|nr:permease [Planctomycetota bacterium]
MNPTLLLAIATLALVVGPLFDKLARSVPLVPALVDGATVGGIVVVSFLHLMPEAGAHLGWWALVLMALGLVLPMFAERLLAHGNESLKLPVGVLVVVLLLTHEVIESAALASKANEERVGIATLLVVVGHRLPLGLLLWGHTKQRFGSVWSVAALLAVASMTWFGPVLVPLESATTFTAVLSALLAGGLLHLVLQHAPASEQSHEHEHLRHFAAALGTVIAVAFFVPYLLAGGAHHGHEHTEDVSGFADRLIELVVESAPYLLVGVVGAALIEAFLPVSITRRAAGGSRLRQALMGVAVGTPMPVCSCGVLPIYRSLMRKGVGASASLAFLISAPEIGVDSLLLSWSMLGPSVTFARLACALILALAIGYVVGGVAERVGRNEIEHAHDEVRQPGALRRMRHALLETWGHLAPWILFGLILTAMVEPWISTEWARQTPAWLQVIVLSLAGMPTYICATAATPFAALLLAKGFAPGAVIAFLLTGPATNLTTFGALQRMHSRKVALAFVATAFVVTCALGMAVQLAPLAAQPAGPSSEHAHDHGAPAFVAAALLGVLTLWVLFREGPRAFLGQLWSSEGALGHGHSHAHGAPGAPAQGHDHAHG